MNFSSGALQRRLNRVAPSGGGTPGGLKRVAPGMGAPGPRDGKRQLAPSNSKPAGSLFKANPNVGRQFKALHKAPKPR